MTIVIGRGHNQQRIEIPCGAGIAQYAKDKPEEYKAALHTVCELLNIPG
jgi:hypothetical protein